MHRFDLNTEFGFMYELEKVSQRHIVPDNQLDAVAPEFEPFSDAAHIIESPTANCFTFQRCTDDDSNIPVMVPVAADDLIVIPKLPLPAQPEPEVAVVPSVSVCSNDLPYPTTRTNRPGKRKYRSRTTKLHNFSDKKQRVKIKKKMRQLQQLLPNCNDKVDIASILEDAIVYLKALQLQAQMMSTGMGLMAPMNMMIGSYMNPLFPMLGFPHNASFVPVIVPHPLISLPSHHH